MFLSDLTVVNIATYYSLMCSELLFDCVARLTMLCLWFYEYNYALKKAKQIRYKVHSDELLLFSILQDLFQFLRLITSFYSRWYLPLFECDTFEFLVPKSGLNSSGHQLAEAPLYVFPSSYDVGIENGWAGSATRCNCGTVGFTIFQRYLLMLCSVLWMGVGDHICSATVRVEALPRCYRTSAENLPTTHR